MASRVTPNDENCVSLHMRMLDRNVPFSVVLGASPDPHPYVREQLDRANSEFGNWAYVELSREEILNIWLPAHTDAGIAEGSVANAVALFAASPQQFQCRELIVHLIDNSSPVFLKQSSKAILEHLDGLHRLIAWGWSGRRLAMAYVAGRFISSHQISPPGRTF
jgi:hypothetical protein